MSKSKSEKIMDELVSGASAVPGFDPEDENSHDALIGAVKSLAIATFEHESEMMKVMVCRLANDENQAVLVLSTPAFRAMNLITGPDGRFDEFFKEMDREQQLAAAWKLLEETTLEIKRRQMMEQLVAKGVTAKDIVKRAMGLAEEAEGEKPETVH